MRSAFLLALLWVIGLAGSGCRSAEQTPVQQQIDPEVAPYIAEMQRATGRSDFEAALAFSDSALQHDPDLAVVHFLRGNVFTEMSQLGEAQAAYERVLAIDPYYRGTWFKLGNNAFLQGQYREAIARYEKEQEAMARSPEQVKAYYRNIDREARPAVVLQKGRSYQLLGEPDSARAAYERALALDTTNANAHAWLSELMEEEGEYEEALAHARRALVREPANVDYQYRVGSMLFKMGKTEAAVPYLQSVLQRHPWHEGANYNLAQALLRLGETEKAQRFLERADTLQALQAEIAQAQAAVYQDPDRVDRWTDLARLMLQAGRYDEAERALGAALHAEPDNLFLRNDRANLTLALGDTSAALAAYQDILARDSTFADAWLNLGVVHASSGNMEAARRAWETALRHNPAHAEAKAYLARLDAQ